MSDQPHEVSADYEYDVFFSYKRHNLTLEWTRQVAQQFKHWLSEELGGRPAKIFVDEDCIELGDEWPEALKLAVRRSRCMVCIWSPSYFQSSWCVSEWRSFLEREKLAKVRPHGLIAPLKFHDGEFFPEEARRVEWVDVSPYAVTVPAFWASAKAIELEGEIKKFARKVAAIIGNAPAFRADWPIVEQPGTPTPQIPLARL